VEDVPVSALARGDKILVKPGERIPTDGVIVVGRTTVNQALLTGESQPVERGEGDGVIGGAVNGESAIVVAVERTGSETYLAQVIELVRQAQASRSRTQDLADRAALWLTIIALSAGGTTLAIWLWNGRDLAFALERMVTVMVIACPHALGLAIPLVIAVSTTLAARNGLLVRTSSRWAGALWRMCYASPRRSRANPSTQSRPASCRQRARGTWRSQRRETSERSRARAPRPWSRASGSRW
jgi:Cu2+-exporting ATPase